MKIKRQLTLWMIIFCVILLLIGASAVYTGWQVQKLSQQQEIANNVVRGAYELSYLSNDYLFHLEKRPNIQWNSRFVSLSDDIARLDVDKPEQQVLVNRIIANKERLQEIYTESVAVIEAAKNTPGGSVDPGTVQVAWSRFIVQNQGIIFDASQLVQMLNEEEHQLQSANTLIMFSLLAVFCGILFTSYVFINQRILKSLSTLKDGTEIIGSGNLDFTIEEDRTDEIGALSHAFNRMTMNLKATTATKEALEKEIDVRKRAEDALRQANRKLNLLSGITRHDINNQLTVLLGHLQILQKEQPDPSTDEYFEKAATAAQRISAMIRFTKEYEEIGVNAPVWQNCRMLADTAATQVPLGNVMVKNDLPAGTEVFADPLVARVFFNLVDNAVRYGNKITTIRFSAQESGDNPVIICEDDGDGVAAIEKEKIFERGFGKNTGLGLALSREILGITGISIRETGVPGTGARFEMTVPPGAYRSTGATAPPLNAAE